MRTGAGTPEELEMLLEDAFVMRDASALSELFEDGAAVLVTNGRDGTRAAGPLWPAVRDYVGEVRRIVQAGDIVLLLGERTAGVLRRGVDRSWRYAIAVLEAESAPAE